MFYLYYNLPPAERSLEGFPGGPVGRSREKRMRHEDIDTGLGGVRRAAAGGGIPAAFSFVRSVRCCRTGRPACCGR